MISVPNQVLYLWNSVIAPIIKWGFCNDEVCHVCCGVAGIHCVFYGGCNYSVMEFGENWNVNIY